MARGETAKGRRFDPFAHLVDVTDRAALLAWGGFWLEDRDGDVWVVDDDEIGPGGTIGESSPSYGHAIVEVMAGDRVVGRAETTDVNHTWVEGLEPDTTYRYRIAVDGRPWLPEPGSVHTHPSNDAHVPVAFAALGDYGVGIVNGEAGRRQAAVARTLDWLTDNHDLRCVIGLGDNIYGGDEDRLEQSGDEDDDWYFTFYAPYRHVIERVPFYPAAGNHDGPDEEANDDRAQLDDNFHISARFTTGHGRGRASLDPGLFYRLRLGADVELVCVDTSWGAERGQHWFDDEEHHAWLRAALTDEPAPRWRIPFSHHPAWCAGPHHVGMAEQVERLVPLYRDGGVRLLLHGHEHNFQHGRVFGIDYVVSGAGGKLDERKPRDFDIAGTRSWAAEPHCLLVEVDQERIVVTPYAGMAEGDAEPRVLPRRTPADEPTSEPIVVSWSLSSSPGRTSAGRG